MPSAVCFGNVIVALGRLIDLRPNIRIIPSLAMKSALQFPSKKRDIRIPKLDVIRALTSDDFGTLDIDSKCHLPPKADTACYLCKKVCVFDGQSYIYTWEWELKHRGEVIYSIPMVDISCSRCTFLALFTNYQILNFPQPLVQICVDYLV
jgi:hypothetical protein